MCKDTVVIHGIKYKAVDSNIEETDITCGNCDIYRAKITRQLPLCCEDKYKKVNKSCCEQFEKGIKRIWKRV